MVQGLDCGRHEDCQPDPLQGRTLPSFWGIISRWAGFRCFIDCFTTETHHPRSSPSRGCPHSMTDGDWRYPGAISAPQVLSRLTEAFRYFWRNWSILSKLSNLFIEFVVFPYYLFSVWRVSRCRRCNRCGFSPWVRKISWRRKWQPTPIFLPGGSHGQRNLASYSPCS